MLVEVYDREAPCVPLCYSDSGHMDVQTTSSVSYLMMILIIRSIDR